MRAVRLCMARKAGDPRRFAKYFELRKPEKEGNKMPLSHNLITGTFVTSVPLGGLGWRNLPSV